MRFVQCESRWLDEPFRNPQRIWIDMGQEIAIGVRFFMREKPIVEAYLCGQCVGSRDPVNHALDLLSLKSPSVLGVHLDGTLELQNVSRFVLNRLITTNDVAIS